MKIRLVALMLVGLGCEDTTLSRCGVPCFDAAPKHTNVGACRQGYTSCNAAGEVTGCVGQSTPTPERCDLVDNDCDGLVDNDVIDDLVGTPCGSGVGECELGQYICSSGVVGCHAPIGPQPEDCDGLDNDCDGLVDNVELDIQAAFCWTHPTRDDAWQHQPCRAGIRQCTAGEWVCPVNGQGAQVWPAPVDTCGDNIDNDCNGVVDDVPTSTYTPPLVDIVFAVDRSGSMSCCMANVRSAITTFVRGTGADSRYQYWFIDIPGRFTTVPLPNPTCSPPGSPVLGCSASTANITAGQLTYTYGGTEYTWDAIEHVSTGVPPLDVAWRPNSARFIILFGDEPAAQLGTASSEAAAAAAAANNHVTVHLFVNMAGTYRRDGVDYWMWEDYDAIANQTNGALHDVRTPADALLQLFEEIIPPVCGGQ